MQQQENQQKNKSSHFSKALSWSIWVLFYGVIPTMILIIAKEVFGFSTNEESKSLLPDDFICTCASFLTGGILVDLRDLKGRHESSQKIIRLSHGVNFFYYASILFIFMLKTSTEFKPAPFMLISYIILLFSFILSIFAKYKIYKSEMDPVLIN